MMILGGSAGPGLTSEARSQPVVVDAPASAIGMKRRRVCGSMLEPRVPDCIPCPGQRCSNPALAFTAEVACRFLLKRPLCTSLHQSGFSGNCLSEHQQPVISRNPVRQRRPYDDSRRKILAGEIHGVVVTRLDLDPHRLPQMESTVSPCAIEWRECVVEAPGADPRRPWQPGPTREV